MIKYAAIYAVDFDGTLCRNKWPEIGEPNETLLEYLKAARAQGSKVILWTMREGQTQEQAIAWCREHGLEFDAVNDNIEDIKASYGNNPRKVFANVYIDDHNMDGTLWPFQEVMEPHGRLIDLDAKVDAQYYDEEHEEWSIKTVSVEDVLYGSCEQIPPTIIPASEETED